VSEFTVESLDHVTVTAPEELEEEVLGFYENFLGLRRLEKPEGSRTAGGRFALGESELHVSRDSHNPPPVAHIAITVKDFAQVVQHLRASGFHIEQARPIAGRKRCFTRDPAGNRIEIVSYTQ
jgi:catechol 2,3-dioxygenase-like lactoylglutathione lyase family enzyme